MKVQHIFPFKVVWQRSSQSRQINKANTLEALFSNYFWHFNSDAATLKEKETVEMKLKKIEAA